MQSTKMKVVINKRVTITIKKKKKSDNNNSTPESMKVKKAVKVKKCLVNQFSFGWRSLSTRHSEKRGFLSVANVIVECHATTVGDNADSDNKVLSSIKFKLQETV